MRFSIDLPHFKTLLIAANVTFTAVFLAACSLVEDEQPPTPPMFQFGAAAPFVVSTQSIEIIEEFQPTYQPPNVEHEYTIPLVAVARAWGEKRLTARGDNGALKFIIRDASLIQKNLETTSSWRDAMVDEPNIRLDARLEIVIEYEGPIGDVVSRAVVAAKSTSYESATVAEMDREYYEMLEEMASELDSVLADQFDSELSQLLVAP